MGLGQAQKWQPQSFRVLPILLRLDLLPRLPRVKSTAFKCLHPSGKEEEVLKVILKKIKNKGKGKRNIHKDAAQTQRLSPSKGVPGGTPTHTFIYGCCNPLPGPLQAVVPVS